MHALKTNFSGNPNLGLYGFATDKYCLIGKGVREDILEEIKNALKVKVHEITINNSRLVGAYCCGNDNLILVPEIIKEHEEKELKKTGIPYKKIKTKFCALGNNIVIKGNTALINPEFEKEIFEELKMLKLKKMHVKEHNAIGSCIVLNKNGGLISFDADEEEIKEIEKELGLKIEPGSVNKGNRYVRTGIIINSNGYIIGGLTTGVETMIIDNIFGFLK